MDSKNPVYASDSYGVFYNKNMTTLYQAPGGLSGTYRIPEGVTTINGAAFKGCGNLTAVTVPAGVTSTGNYTFRDCPALTEVRFYGNAPTFGSDVFYGDTTTVYYLASNSTWTDSVKKNYGGTLTWVGLCGSGHTVVTEPGTPATCTRPGVSGGSCCSVCLLVAA